MVMKLVITFLVSMNVSLSYCRGGLFTTAAAAAAVYNIHTKQLYSEIYFLTEKKIL